MKKENLKMQSNRTRKSMIKRENKRRVQNGDKEILDYCAYTKEPIYIDDDYVYHEGKYYSIEGWKQENDIIEEICFERI